jgi:hypothetical protein
MEFTKLIYENPLATADDVKDFVMEGSAAISFPRGRMRMENLMDAAHGQKSNFVYWCPVDFPSDLRIIWDFYPIYEPGLCILFFSAKGRNGEDILTGGLSQRAGEYQQYHSGEMNAYHVSYFRRKWEDERSFHTCNLRKSHGFHLVAQGADPIPSVSDAVSPYKIALEKDGGNVSFYINDLHIFTFKDDGKAYGEVLQGGKIGFRQMAPLIGEYANLKVYGR